GYGSTATQQPLAARTLPRADAYPQNTLRSFENSDARAAFQGESPRGAALATPPASLDRPSIITESGSSDLPREASSDSGDDLSRFNSVDCRNALTEHGIGAEAAEVADKLFRFRRALRLCPENPLFHVELGRTYVAMGRTDDAQYEFEEALRLDSGYEPASKELAFLKNRF
ncbi:MAG: hypothetical protein KDD64_08100, partial [Bdellovibrionales bacterium]|nr:hypothetical protein [Bdellovibrionales bacterium]